MHLIIWSILCSDYNTQLIAMSLTENLFTVYEYAFDTKGDVRVSEWMLMRGPGPLLCLLVVYLLLVKHILPEFMKYRTPFRLTAVLAVYNTAQVIACSWLVHQTVQSIRSNNLSFLSCSATNYTDDPNAIRLAGLCWWYLILKLADLIETMFFVLRKKSQQVSFLHLYHHVSTPLYSWAMVKFAAGGTPSVYVVVNSAVHVFMYLYYLFTGIGWSKPLAPWKRYLTILQMVQFCAVMIHASQLVIFDCSVPKLLSVLFIPNVAIVFYMFSEFYNRAYSACKLKEG